MAGLDLPAFFQFNQRQPVGRVAINLVCGGENEDGFGTELALGLQQVQGRGGVDAEIRVWIARGPVV